jgi:hypothetical protein
MLDMLRPVARAVFQPFRGRPRTGLLLLTLLLPSLPAAAQGALPELTIEDASAREGADAYAIFRVSLSAASSETVTVNYAVNAGTALFGSDFTASPGTLTFTPGRRVHMITVPIVHDDVDEPAETFAVSLVSPSGAVLARSRATGTIQPTPMWIFLYLYRLYNPFAGFHFFTTSPDEKSYLLSLGWRDEGVVADLPNKSSSTLPSLPVLRLYGPTSGRHYYTSSAGEAGILMGYGWLLEGNEGYVHPEPHFNNVQIFRLYNQTTGAHLYTSSTFERDFLLTTFPDVWVQHGILGWGVKHFTPSAEDAEASEVSETR